MDFEELKSAPKAAGDEVKKVSNKLKTFEETLTIQDKALSSLLKEIAGLKKKEEAPASPDEATTNKLKKLEKLQTETASMLDDIIGKLEQTNKSVSDVEQK